MKDFRLDGKEILSVDSDFNESTNLWWMKTDLLWIRPTTNNLRRSPGVTCQNTHERISFMLGALVWCRSKIIGHENQWWNDIEDRQRETVSVVEG